MIKAAIFDMDGLLIDSEPFWEESYIDRLASLGVPREEITKPEHKGRGTREFLNYWQQHYPWGDSPTIEELSKEMLTHVEKRVVEAGRPLPGVIETLELLRSKGFDLAVASSSPVGLINAVVNKLNIKQFFSALHSGTLEESTKPHPAVFLSTANRLGVKPNTCLVFEDSVNGVVAAKAASMKCIAVPEQQHLNDRRFNIADVTLSSLVDFDDKILATL